MANYEDLLKKNKKRISSIKGEPKKLERKGPVRPWQVEDTQTSSIESKIDQVEFSNEPISNHSSSDIAPLKPDLERTKITEQIRNSSVTVPELSDRSSVSVLNELRNSSVTNIQDSLINSSELRNSSGTKDEYSQKPALEVTEQFRYSSGTKTGPSIDLNEISSLDKRSKKDSKTQKDSEQLFRNSSGTNTEHVLKSFESRNNSVTGTGTISEQINVYSLPRSESKIMSALVGICINSGNTVTPQLSYEKLSELSGVPLESTKTLVKRLEKKGFLKRIEGRRGPGAWTVIELPVATYQAFITYSHRSAALQATNPYFNNSGINSGTSKGTGLGTELSSSSNNINYSNTTTEKVEKWTEIKIPAILATVGFTSTHAKQVLSDKENKLTFEEVQESFDNFAFDVEHSKVTVRTNHVSYLMSVLRGQRIQYISLFQKEQERLQLEEYMREIKKEEDLKKMKLQVELSQKFAEWLRQKSQDEKNEIVPPTSFVSEGSQIQENLLKSHFCKIHGFDID